MAAIYGVQWRWNRLRGARPEDERAEVDRQPCRPDLRFALPAASPGGGLCVRRLEGEVCERLRGGVDQSDEQRSLRGCPIEVQRPRIRANPSVAFESLGD